MMSIGITLFMAFGVTCLAMQTRFDFPNLWLVVICVACAAMDFFVWQQDFQINIFFK